jgi:hypothetical protein
MGMSFMLKAELVRKKFSLNESTDEIYKEWFEHYNKLLKTDVDFFPGVMVFLQTLK